MLSALQLEGGYLCNEDEKKKLEAAMWDENENRTFSTIACPPQQIANACWF
jgi:sulfoacetaldehyde dehydrogenase